MINAKNTKRALLTSVVALVLCFTMLLGTTFAWFTDTVVSANNIIKSGNLDITLEYFDGEWKDVKGSSDILAGDHWEPGYVDVAYFRIKNAGSLALKYQFGVNIVSETAGKTATGETITLSDYIYYDVFEGVNGETAAFADRDAALENTTETTLISAGYTKPGTLEKDSDYVYLAMVVYMPDHVDNVANHDGENKPSIDLGIEVLATQHTKESDSFNDQYDAAAGFGTTVIYDKNSGVTLFDSIKNLKNGDVLVLPEGEYITSGSFQVPAGVTIMGAEGANVVFHQNSAAQDDIFQCAGDATFINVTFESNRKGYAITDNTKNHDTDGDITVIGCTFKGIATEKNYGVYKNLYGNLTIKNCTFDNYNNAVCGVNNGGESTTVITGCTFTNINGEAIGYVSSSVEADFEANAINNNTGLTAENVIGY